jgi:hypothetical protein
MAIMKIAHGGHKANPQSLAAMLIQVISKTTDGMKNLH